MKLRIAICEDEAVQRTQIRRMTEEFFYRENRAVQIFEYAGAMQLLIEAEAVSPFDAILLDIQMEQMDGIALAKELRKKDEALVIIFITASTDYIFEGFSVNALNYLVKPVAREQLWACLRQAVSRKEQQEEFLLLQSQKELLRLKKSALVRVRSDGHYLTVVTKEQSIRVKMPLKELEQMLKEPVFFHLSRSDLICLTQVERIGKRELWMTDGECIPIPRGRHRAVSEAFLDCHLRPDVIGRDL